MNEAVTQKQFIYCSDVSCQEPLLFTPSGQKLKVHVQPGQPPIFIDPTGEINGGRPTSVFDILYEQHHGTKLPRGSHAVPNGDSERMWDNFAPEYADVLTAKEIHAEYAKAPGRGRKPSITLAVAAKVKTAYYRGDKTLASMADDPTYGSLSKNTLTAIVNGRSYWYA